MISSTSLPAFSVQPRPTTGPSPGAGLGLGQVKPVTAPTAAVGGPQAQTPPGPATRRGALLDISA
ncbi:hypothetical protein [Lichenicoccus sp.]|uniref:hypothetical protein n=1 Tax=Lichenicoccus sp. TaxID=2781899 RepID=UPI003D123FF7